jgi:hypothetical protein
MNAALAAGLLGIELPRRLPFRTDRGKKPALLGEDVLGKLPENPARRYNSAIENVS